MREIHSKNQIKKLTPFELIKNGLSKDMGNIESALVLIPLLILFFGVIQLYSFHNIKSAMELVAEGVAESSITIQSTVAAQFAAEEYLTRIALPKFIKTEQLEVTVKDEEFSEFVVRKVYLSNTTHSKGIGHLSLKVSATVILN